MVNHRQTWGSVYLKSWFSFWGGGQVTISFLQNGIPHLKIIKKCRTRLRFIFLRYKIVLMVYT